MVRQVDEHFFQKKAVVGWKLVNFPFNWGTPIGVKIFHSKKTDFLIAIKLHLRNNPELVIQGQCFSAKL